MNSCFEKNLLAVRALLISSAAALALTARGCAAREWHGDPSINASTFSVQGHRHKGRAISRRVLQPPLPVKRNDQTKSAETAWQRLLRKGYSEPRSAAPNGGN